MAIDSEQEVGPGADRPKKRRKAPPGTGLVKGLGVTLKHMLQPSITQEYPDEKPDLPARTRGVIALKQENCTVCWKCSRECPDWCIYIESHKETHPPASGRRAPWRRQPPPGRTGGPPASRASASELGVVRLQAAE